MNDPEHTAETEWLERSRRGDKEAYGLLVKKCMRQAYFVALGYVGSHEDALDLSQEAFARGFAALHKFDPQMKFYTWYYQILKHLCLNFLRQRKSRSLVMTAIVEVEGEDSSQGLASDELPADARMEKAELRENLWKALWDLELEERELIVARDILNTPYQTLAELLDCPVGTVMSRLYYARRRLREKLERRM